MITIYNIFSFYKFHDFFCSCKLDLAVEKIKVDQISSFEHFLIALKYFISYKKFQDHLSPSFEEEFKIFIPYMGVSVPDHRLFSMLNNKDLLPFRGCALFCETDTENPSSLRDMRKLSYKTP